MSLLIDGYNLLHVTGLFGRVGPASFQRSREALLNFLAQVLDNEERSTTTIVFDAAEAPPGLPNHYAVQDMQVFYARNYASADDLLEELIQADHSPKRLTVVSSDHRVQRAAKKRRATAVDSHVWYGQMHLRWQGHAQAKRVVDAKPEAPVPSHEVAHWLKLFGEIDVASLEVELSARVKKATKAPVKKSPVKTKPTSKKSKPTTKTEQPTKRAGKLTTRKKQPPRGTTPPAKKSRQPPDLGFGSIENPFPPGYGEDLLHD